MTVKSFSEQASSAAVADENYQAYLREADELEKTMAGHMVAYADGGRIAAGRDGRELAKNIPDEYRYRRLFIKTIASAKIHFRRPSFRRQGQ
ncbi:MAG TPA: hypothetical protein VI756_22065 [Blastocatellia bacterium]